RLPARSGSAWLCLLSVTICAEKRLLVGMAFAARCRGGAPKSAGEPPARWGLRSHPRRNAEGVRKGIPVAPGVAVTQADKHSWRSHPRRAQGLAHVLHPGRELVAQQADAVGVLRQERRQRFARGLACGKALEDEPLRRRDRLEGDALVFPDL